MSDILDRLWNLANSSGAFGGVYREAADEIRRLREIDDVLSEGLDITNNLTDSIQRHGNYSAESTVVFVDQVGACIRAARAALKVSP